MTEGSETYTNMEPDPYYEQGPACVICKDERICEGRKSCVNPALTGNWLHWRALAGASRPDYYRPGDVSLGNYGHYELFVDPDHQENVAKFALFVLAAATQSDTSGGSSAGGGGATSGGGSSGGGGGGGGGGAGSPLLSAPVPQLLIPNQ
jgi:hypothetical protein